MDEKKALLMPFQSPSCLRKHWFSCIPARYVLAAMTTFGFTIVYALRVNLSVAIVQMDNDTATVHAGSAKVFDWTSTEQGWVLAAFFYGYLLTQIPGGWLAQRVGGKWVFGLGVVMTSVFTLFTPLATDTSVWLLIAVRVLEGLSEGVTYPAVHAMWGKWAPPLERTKLTTVGFAGALGIIWFVLWSFLAYSTPATHPRISKEEREYIESSIAESAKSQFPTPWLRILTSPAVWAIIISSFCGGWGHYTLLTCMPTYFKQVLPVLQVNRQATVLSGVYSAIPSLVTMFVIVLSGQIADYMRSTRFSTALVRKSFTVVGGLGSATFLLLCGYLGTSTVTAVTFLTLSTAFSGVGLSGFHVNHLDIAPRFAGVIMGITNLAGVLAGMIAPQVAKAIAIEPNAPMNSEAYLDGYKDEWREVFVITAELYLFGAVVYLILGSGKEQPWASGPADSNRKEKVSTFTKTDGISRTLCDENRDAEPKHVRFVFSGTACIQQEHKDHSVDHSCQWVPS